MSKIPRVLNWAASYCQVAAGLFAAMVVLNVSSIADDWPQWGGPERDCVWHEVGIVDKLPTDGLLPRVWSVAVAEGYSGPAVAEGRVFLSDRIAAQRYGSMNTMCDTRLAIPTGLVRHL